MTERKNYRQKRTIRGVLTDQHEEPGTASAILRERAKLDMVRRLRELGRPATPTEIAEGIGASAVLVGRIAAEAPRTFVTRRLYGGGRKYHVSSSAVVVELHPHLVAAMVGGR